MGHFNPDAAQVERRTPDEWLEVGAQLGELANDLANRLDIVTYIGPTKGDIKAAALFIPSSAELQINTSAAFGKLAKPETIKDLRQRENQYDHPAAIGALFHEAMHAKFTSWDLEAAYKELSPTEYEAMHWLEEPRIERLGLLAYPKNRGFLRSCVLKLVLNDKQDEKEPPSTTRSVAQLSVLALGRVHAGSLEKKDVKKIRKIVVDHLGKDLFKKLDDICLEFQQIRYEPARLAHMYELAREWDRLVQEEAENRGEIDENGNPTGEPGEGLPGDLQDIMGQIMDALGQDADSTSVAVHRELSDQETIERNEAQAQARSKDAQEERDHKETANKVFNQGPRDSNGQPTSSKLDYTRNPESKERVAANVVSRALDKAKYRDRVRVASSSVTPPGRLRSRAAVQGSAYRSMGVADSSTPWRRIQRKHVDDPDLDIGVLVDISGSMGGAMEPMASTAWILSEAARRIQATAAMVYFGQSVFATLSPGQHLDKVNVYTAPDSSHNFDLGFQALDGALGLLNGAGARLLVVVSDGAYTSHESAKVDKWLARCQKAGVAVLWLGYGSSSPAAAFCAKTNAVFLKPPATVEGVAGAIGRAAQDALKSADAMRNSY